MPDESGLIRDLLDVLARHGVRGLPEAASALGVESPVSSAGAIGSIAGAMTSVTGGIRQPGSVASYIREIITGDVAFDERVLSRVTSILSRGTGR